jgi:DNA (cytosine-5)-methyltransferase 1
MNEKEIRFFSMFTGVGGFELGFEKAGNTLAQPEDERSEAGRERTAAVGEALVHIGQLPAFRCVGYSEIDRHAISVFHYHWPKLKNYGDATKINPGELPEFDLLCGGFPCQSFSIAGKRKGFGDTRGTLFNDIVRVAAARRPRLLLLENVKGLLSHDGGRTLAIILSSLQDVGYKLEWEVLNSKNFGVPQNRERIFIVGHLGEGCPRAVFPVGSDDKTVDENRTSVRAICGGGHSGGLHSQSTCISRSVRAGGRGSKDEKHRWDVIPVLTPGRTEKRQNGPRFKEAGEPSFTLTGIDVHGIMVANCITADAYLQRGERKRVNGRPVLTSVNERRIRRLTPVECERLQGFPDNWTKFGLDESGKTVPISDTQRYKMMGNAVTTNVIQAIAERILENGASK